MEQSKGIVGMNVEKANDSAVKDLLNKFQNGSLSSSDLREYWKIWMNKYFYNHWVTSIESGLVKCNVQMLLDTLEDFIFNESQKKLLLKREDVCRKVLKQDEFYFSCFVCRSGRGSIMCLDCFMNSTHRFHQYEFGISKGEGLCCDCGVVDVWKNNPHCDDHLKALRTQYELPEDVLFRASYIVDRVVNDCLEIWCQNPSSSIPTTNQDTEDITNRDIYCAVLYLKGGPSFDSTKEKREFYEPLVPEIGQCIPSLSTERGTAVACDSYSVCSTAMNKLENIIKEISLPMKGYICHWYLLAQHTVSLELLSWLTKLMLKYKKLREVFLSVVSTNPPPSLCLTDECLKKSLLDIIILRHNSMLWNSAKSVWFNVISTCMLTDYENKCVFAKVFLKHYGFIMNHSLSIHYSIGLNVTSQQVFPVPSLAQQLVEDENALEILLSVLETTYSAYLCTSNNDSDILKTCRYKLNHIIKDLEYILDFKTNEWSCKLRENFIRGVNVYLKILVFLQKNNSPKSSKMVKNLTFPQVLNLENKMSVDNKIIRLCSNDEAVFINLYKLTLKAISENLIPCLEKVSSTNLAGHCAQLFFYKSSSEGDKSIFPIFRFFAGLYQVLQTKKSLDYRSPDFTSIVKPTPEQLIDPVLNMLVADAKRYHSLDNRSLHNLNLFYERSEMLDKGVLDKDIFLLQIGASLIDNNVFLITLLNKFELLSWVNELDTTIDGTQDSITNIKDFGLLGEDFLLLIIYIIGERYNPAISTVTSYECSKYKMFHSLSAHSKTYDKLVAEFTYLNEDEVKNILKDVATAKQNKDELCHDILYVANEDHRSSYNKYYCAYKLQDRESSHIEQRKVRKLLDGIDCCPPPQLRKVKPCYQPLTTLLHSDVMLNIMSTVLSRSLNPKSECYSEKQFLMILHLIGYGLWEEENEHGVLFTDNAQKWNIEPLLEKLDSTLHMESCKDLIHWIVKKFRLVKNKNNVNFAEPSKCSEIVKENHENKLKQVESKVNSKKRAATMNGMCSLQHNFFKKLIKEENIPSHYKPEESVKIWKCILCQMEEVSNNRSAIVLGAYVQKSRVLTRNQDMLTNWFPTITGDYHSGHVNTCGHAMHVHCLEHYLETLQSTSNSITNMIAECLFEKNEFVCPLCEFVCNTKMPIISQSYKTDGEILFTQWLQKIKGFCAALEASVLNENITSGQVNPSNLVSDGSGTKEVVFPELKELMKSSYPILPEVIVEACGSFVQSIAKCYDISSSEKAFLLVWQVCSYTICCLERYKCSMGISLLGYFSYSESRGIENLVNISLMLSTLYQNALSQSTVIHNILLLLFGGNKIRKINVLNWECFELFFLLNMVLPNYIKVSCQKINFDKNLFRMIMILNFAKIILNSDISKFVHLDFDNVCDDTRSLVKLVKLFKDCKGVNAVELWNFIKESSIPFLNSCGLFYYFLTGKKPSNSLGKVGGNTFENLVDYIGLSFRCDDLLNSDFIFETISAIAEHPDVQAQRRNTSFTKDIIRYKKLVSLPKDFCEIIFMASKYNCPHKKKKLDLKTANLCLFCNKIFCNCRHAVNGKIVNCFKHHMIACQCETGIFLDMKSGFVKMVLPHFNYQMESSIIMYTNERNDNLVVTSDCRNRPLYLNNKLYSKLNRCWLAHTITEEVRKNSPLLSFFK